MANEEKAVIHTVEGVVLATNVEPAKNGKVYPKVTFQGKGRFNPQVECVPELAEQVRKLKPGQRVLFACYTKVGQVEVQKKDGGTFKKTVDYFDNAYSVRILG